MTDGNYPVEIIWELSAVNSCVGSGDWSGPKSSNPGYHNTVRLGKVSDFTSDKTYTLTCTNPAGSVTKSVKFSLEWPPGSGINPKNPPAPETPKLVSPLVIPTQVTIPNTSVVVPTSPTVITNTTTISTSSLEKPISIPSKTPLKETLPKIKQKQPEILKQPVPVSNKINLQASTTLQSDKNQDLSKKYETNLPTTTLPEKSQGFTRFIKNIWATSWER